MSNDELLKRVEQAFEPQVEKGQYLEPCPLWERDNLWRVRVNIRDRDTHRIVKSSFFKVDMGA